jgi:hypothetical protein
MDLNKFIEKTPFLYHLTSEKNASYIIKERKLHSANQLIEMSGDHELQHVKREKRNGHLTFKIGESEVSLRDQQPISLVALPKCLTDGWQVGDFLFHLNERVFMWPNLKRLWAHYNRYKLEKPVIFRFSTEDILIANPHVKFCRLNSGATRANSYLGGIAPHRGPNTFLNAEEFTLPINNVAEVTFENICIIVGDFSIADNPDGPFKMVD